MWQWHMPVYDMVTAQRCLNVEEAYGLNWYHTPLPLTMHQPCVMRMIMKSYDGLHAAEGRGLYRFPSKQLTSAKAIGPPMIIRKCDELLYDHERTQAS